MFSRLAAISSVNGIHASPRARIVVVHCISANIENVPRLDTTRYWSPTVRDVPVMPCQSTTGPATPASATPSTAPSASMNACDHDDSRCAPATSPRPSDCDRSANVATDTPLPMIIGRKPTVVATCTPATASAPKRPTSTRSTRLNSA